MVLPEHPVTLSPEQVAQLYRRLSEARHSVNNNLALIVAASELLRRKPEMAGRVAEALSEPPQRIVDEIRRFSGDLDEAMGVRPESRPGMAELH